ncbi:MAG: DUF3455 domain-containing protein [Burkholderiaceae bacterium]
MIKSITALSCVVLLGACATPVPVEVPANLKPSANESFSMIVPAKGVQIYECRLGKDAAPQWTFVAPEAALFDARGNTIGQHGAGPYWQARDGSRIVGTLKQRADAPDPAAIPWLLLSSKSNGSAGVFSNVSSIQRVNTVGGIAPATGCAADLAGKTARIPYTADYYFFTNR